MNNKVKLLVMGPPECGKTTLSNYLSQTVEVGGNEYRPTRGCRIVEFEVPNVMVNESLNHAEVELWDVSGDRRYESCWPAIRQGANGLIVVYNPGIDDSSRILEGLMSTMIEEAGLTEAQCIVFCHHKPGTQGRPADLPQSFSKVPQIETKLDEDGSMVRTEFTKFISSVFTHMSAVARRQENFILQ